MTLTSVFIPNPKVFLQEILQKDNLDTYLSLYDEFNYLLEYCSYKIMGSNEQKIEYYYNIDPLPKNILQYYIINIFIGAQESILMDDNEINDQLSNYFTKNKELFRIYEKKFLNYLSNTFLHGIINNYKEFKYSEIDKQSFIKIIKEYNKINTKIACAPNDFILIDTKLLENKESRYEYQQWSLEILLMMPRINKD